MKTLQIGFKGYQIQVNGKRIIKTKTDNKMLSHQPENRQRYYKMWQNFCATLAKKVHNALSKVQPKRKNGHFAGKSTVEKDEVQCMTSE